MHTAAAAALKGGLPPLFLDSLFLFSFGWKDENVNEQLAATLALWEADLDAIEKALTSRFLLAKMQSLTSPPHITASHATLSLSL